MKIDKLYKTIDDYPVLDDISFELKPGEIIGLFGRNGAGKTTLFRVIHNIYKKESGSITINSQPLEDNPDVREQLFYLDEHFNILANQTPESVSVLYQQLYSTFDTEKFNSLLLKHHLDPKKRISAYSKGMQALFKMILAFSTNARYYLLDEPFDGLDIIVRKQVIQLVLNEVSIHQYSVLISSHNLSELELIVDRALILQKNTIIKEYDLTRLRETTRKYQLVLKKKQVPHFIKEEAKIIQVQGRVLILIIDNMTDDFHQRICDLEPVLFEELSVNLEDLFAANFTEELDYQLFY